MQFFKENGNKNENSILQLEHLMLRSLSKAHFRFHLPYIDTYFGGFHEHLFL